MNNLENIREILSDLVECVDAVFPDLVHAAGESEQIRMQLEIDNLEMALQRAERYLAS